LITDGRFSGGTRGECIGHIAPEAAAHGPIAALQDGDVIDIDLDARTLNVRLADEILQARLAALPPFVSKVHSKWLRRYAHFVTSADTGAVLEDEIQ
jgi:dihydroxy-acid dehydratase